MKSKFVPHWDFYQRWIARLPGMPLAARLWALRQLSSNPTFSNLLTVLRLLDAYDDTVRSAAVVILQGVDWESSRFRNNDLARLSELIGSLARRRVEGLRSTIPYLAGLVQSCTSATLKQHARALHGVALNNRGATELDNALPVLLRRMAATKDMSVSGDLAEVITCSPSFVNTPAGSPHLPESIRRHLSTSEQAPTVESARNLLNSDSIEVVIAASKILRLFDDHWAGAGTAQCLPSLNLVAEQQGQGELLPCFEYPDVALSLFEKLGSVKLRLDSIEVFRLYERASVLACSGHAFQLKIEDVYETYTGSRECWRCAHKDPCGSSDCRVEYEERVYIGRRAFVVEC